MDFLTLKLFPASLVEAVGSTLIHSLWQGVVLSIITGLIVICTRKSSSAMRYNLLVGALISFIVGVAVTFYIVFTPTIVNKAYFHKQITGLVQQVSTINQPTFKQIVPKQETFKETAINFINKNANSIVLIWFVIVCARSLQLASGLNGLYYLRRKSIYKIDDQLETRVKELAVKLGISGVVKIAQSGIAKVPMVIGHLKPLILIPIGLVTKLAPEEVEAILIHELAHIRRRDYLINMLQSFMEIIFFFNPAVLWISSLIKTERENCCDDIVVSQSSSKANYIKALVSCQEYHMTTPAYALALTGNKNHLLTRVKRMLSNKNQSLNVMEKSILALCLVSAGLLTAAFTNSDKINTLVTKTAKAIEHIAGGGRNDKKTTILKTSKAKTVAMPTAENTTLPAFEDTVKAGVFKVYRAKEVKANTSISVQNARFVTYLYKQDGILYQLNYRHKFLYSMEVNGKTIPDNNIDSYQTIINKILLKNQTESAGLSNHSPSTEKPDAAPNTNEKQVSAEEIQKMLANIVAEKADETKKNQLHFEEFVNYGDAYRNTGDYNNALNFYNKAELINPINPDLEKKITDTKILIENKKTPEEKEKDRIAEAKERELSVLNGLITYGDYCNTRLRYQDAMEAYKKAWAIDPNDKNLQQKIDYTQKLLNQSVADSINHAFSNSSSNTVAKKANPAKATRSTAIAPVAAYSASGYSPNYAYTAAGKSEIARKDSINRAQIIDDMKKDGLIETTDNLSFKISTEEFIVNGKKQPDDIYQKYRAKYVKVTGHGDWSWYYNYDTANKKTTNTTVDNNNSKN